MNDWTRRDFLNTATGAAISGALIGHTRVLNSATGDIPTPTIGASGTQSDWAHYHW
jgi:hypothetical protein